MYQKKVYNLVIVVYIVLFLLACCLSANAGSVTYVWNLTNDSEIADYLIIAHESFYDNVDLLRLAQYRADAQNFGVSIVNLSDITQQFNESAVDPANDTAVKNFINYTYENWTKNVRTNNDIFVLLVGDIQDDVDPEYMPSHLSDLTDVAGGGIFTDNWFADVNGSDYKPDVYIGRFAVKDNVNLSIIANKTVKYENETNLVNQEWLKRINFINALDETDTNDTYNTIKTSYTDQFGFNYEDILPGFGFGGTTDDITNNISYGAWITNYEGGGVELYWLYSGINGFGCTNVPSLTNGDNLTIIFSFTGSTGSFNTTEGGVTLTECMALADNKGAVAFLGASGETGMSSDLALNSKIFQAIFENNSATLGEAIKLGKDWMVDVGGTAYAEMYNLLGDPALKIKDYKSPGFSEVNVSDLINRQATVTWTTDEASNSTVFYGTTEEASSVSGIDDSVTLHTVTLTGLVKNALYYYNVSSCDANGNCNNSWQGTFTTLSNGSISYYWNLSDTSNSADWLVIAHESFYDNADLYRLAEYRASAQNFDVGIVNLSDITQQFNDTAVDPSNDTAIKNFTAYVYENWTKNVRTNNDIFVLLVGDIKDDVDPEYMPSHLSDLAGDGYTDLTDNWYADVNGSDYKPDVYIGRFAVKDNVNLSIIANKTIRYENETSFVNQEWLKKISFINAADITNPDINNINDTFNTIKSSYTDQFGFTYEDIIPAYDTTATDDIMGNISDGVWITNYEGGGNRNNWVYSAGNGFGCPNVPSLTNGDNLTIVFSFASATGHFNNTNGAVTFTECMSLADNKGAVAFLGASGEPTTSPDLALNRKIFEAIFENNSATLGEAIKAAKDVMVDWSYYSETEIYNLLGDPALRIKDYTDSNISLDSPSDNTVDNDGVVGFNFTVTETNLDTCELYGNWSGGWHVNQSYNGFTQGLTQNFSDITLSDGSYYWNVYCNDSNGNSNFSALNYSLTVDSTYPSISLSTPTNGSSWTSSQTVTFTYSVSDLGVSNCSLIINDAVNSTTTGSQSFSITLLNSAYNWSVNCTDNANQENSSEIYDLIVSYSPQDTTPSGGGGGSSSGSVSNGGSVSETVSIATGGGAGETKTLSFSKDVAVTELGITLQNKVSSITLSVEKLTAKPADTTIPTGTAYHYLKIDKNLNDEDVKNAKIKFKVEKSWLTKNGFLAEEILLKRYVKTWEKLSTAYLKSDKDYAYYEADSKGFSYFAITAEKKPAPATTPEIKKEEEKPAEEQPPIKTEEPELKKLNYALYALLLALAAIIIVLLFKKKKVFKTKEKPSKELLSFEELTTSPKIKNFCKEKLSQGYTEKQILESAKEVGWTEEEIRKILNGLKK